MTLGFACAAWTQKDERVVVVAADTRISRRDLPFEPRALITDAGVKTYELGGPCAMVASGSALPPMMAAEQTRSFIENHNRKRPEKKVSFFDTVRLASIFLKRTAEEQSATCRVAVAGFLKAGAPCVACIVVSPGFNRAVFRPIARGGTCAIPVGDPAAGRLVVESMAAAKREGRSVITAALNILVYTSRHPGAFTSVGGGISVGHCMGSEQHFSWPVVEVNGTKFLRGMDVIRFHRSDWPKPEIIAYDEEWCAEQDRRVATELATEPVRSGTLPGFDIDAIASLESIFAAHDEPDFSLHANDELPYPSMTGQARDS